MDFSGSSGSINMTNQKGQIRTAHYFKKLERIRKYAPVLVVRSPLFPGGHDDREKLGGEGDKLGQSCQI